MVYYPEGRCKCGSTWKGKEQTAVKQSNMRIGTSRGVISFSNHGQL